MCTDDHTSILLCGIPSEPPLALVRERLADLGVRYVVMAQRQVADADVELEVRAGRPTGTLSIDGCAHPLESFDGVYLRLMDDAHLPELRGEPVDGLARVHSRAVHELLMQWAEITTARVLNRPSAMASNGSKPFQAQLIAAQGFRVPETLITSEPDLARAFIERHRDIVYKSISGVRSIVRRFESLDRRRLDHIAWCPVQFQEMVTGVDVRVHTVGREVFATAIRSDAADYRYAHQSTGSDVAISPVELSDELAERCVALSSALGLGLAGIDLRVSPTGEAYCFEVNPCPSFSYYEANTGQPIAAAIARYLAGS